MRCKICKYCPELTGWDPDECYTDLCHLIDNNEITENRYGIGCIHNQRTLDKRNKEIEKAMKEGYYW